LRTPPYGMARATSTGAAVPDLITGPYATAAACGGRTAATGAANGLGIPAGGAQIAAGHSDFGSAATYRPVADCPPFPMDFSHQARFTSSSWLRSIRQSRFSFASLAPQSGFRADRASGAADEGMLSRMTWLSHSDLMSTKAGKIGIWAFASPSQYVYSAGVNTTWLNRGSLYCLNCVTMPFSLCVPL
jgi:hypothetical protein